MRPNTGERRAQIVRDRVGHAFDLRDDASDILDHHVDRGGKLVELVMLPGDRHPPIKAAARDLAAGELQVADPAQRLEAERDRGEQHADRHDRPVATTICSRCSRKSLIWLMSRPSRIVSPAGVPTASSLSGP